MLSALYFHPFFSSRFAFFKQPNLECICSFFFQYLHSLFLLLFITKTFSFFPTDFFTLSGYFISLFFSFTLFLSSASVSFFLIFSPTIAHFPTSNLTFLSFRVIFKTVYNFSGSLSFISKHSLFYLFVTYTHALYSTLALSFTFFFLNFLTLSVIISFLSSLLFLIPFCLLSYYPLCFLLLPAVP